MLGRHWLGYGIVVCLCAASPLWAAFPVVGRSTGTMAVQSAGEAEWRVIDAGSVLPNAAEVRTAATGPMHLQADQGTVSLHPLTRLRFDLERRRIELLSGRVYCAAAGEASWTIQVAKILVEVHGGAGTEVAVDFAGDVVVTPLKGPAIVRTPSAPETILTEKSTRTWRHNETVSDPKLLDEAAEKQLRAWTRILPPGQGVGQLVIKDPQQGSRSRLDIARYHAEMILQPPVALVKLDQSFYNPSNRQEEGEFIFNLPPGASVSRFAMFVTRNTLVEGEVIDRRRADQIYTTIVYDRRDPAILEQIGDNLFKMRVFPIFAKDIKRILLDFTMPLEGRGSQFQVRLPLLSDLKPIWEFSLQGRILGGTLFDTVNSTTFPDLKFVSKAPGEIVFDFQRNNYQPRSDFQVAFTQAESKSPTTFRHVTAQPLNLTSAPNQPSELAWLDTKGVVRAGPDDWNSTPATYFLANLPAPQVADNATAPADVVVLVDTSANGSLAMVRPALQTVLASLRDEDRLKLVCVDVAARPLTDDWIQPRSVQFTRAWQEFEQQFCMGATDVLEACRSVSSYYDDVPAGRRRIVIYIGDGIDSVQKSNRTGLDKDCAEAITKAGAGLFAINTVLPLSEHERQSSTKERRRRRNQGEGFFQIGPRTDDSSTEQALAERDGSSRAAGKVLLQRIANATGGRSFDFSPAANDRGNLFQWLLSGLPSATQILNVQVAGAAPQDVYAPDNFLPGENLRVSGRVAPASAASLKVSYSLRSPAGVVENHTVELKPAADDADHMVGRIWAEQRLKQAARMQSVHAESDRDPEVHKLIVQLSREWSILTPETAFLVLENEQEYVRWNVPRQARRPYWSQDFLPPTAPLPPEWLAEIADQRQSGLRVQPIDTELIQAAYKTVRDALSSNNLERAKNTLRTLGLDPRVASSREFNALRQQADQLQRDRRAIRGLGIKQNWFDFNQPVNALPTEIDRLFATTSPLSEFMRQTHPLAEVLMQEIDLPDKPMNLIQLAQYLRATLGIHVAIDVVKLEEENVDPNVPLLPQPLKRITVYNGLQWLLKERGLTYSEEPRRLVITTMVEASMKHQRVTFPIQDLVSNRPRFDFEDLQNPLEDRNDAVRGRVNNKLDRAVTWKLTDASLDEVAQKLRQELDENVVLNKVKLEEESVATDATDLTCDCQNLPLRDVIDEILRAKNLTWTVDREVLQITTQTDGSLQSPLRLYPVSGLIFRDTRPAAVATPRTRTQPPSRWWGLGMGGMVGIGGGGMGGGMGGMGGGFVLDGAAAGGGFGGGEAFDATVEISEFDGPELNAGSPQSDTQPERHLDPDRLVLDPDDAFRKGPGKTDADELVQLLKEQTGGHPDSPWDDDFYSGHIGFYAPGLTLLVRQTVQAHEEIAEVLDLQRKLLARRGSHPDMVPVTPWTAMGEFESDAEVDSLIDLLQTFTAGAPDSPWTNIDGYGGMISYDKPRYALTILQHPHAMEEINSFLVQLRRERYALLHQSRPWGADLLTAARPGLISGPWLAPLTPVQERAGAATEIEMAALKVRRELLSGKWHWLTTTRPTTPVLTLTASEDRLRLNWPGWEIRAKGSTSSVTIPGIRYAEIGAWGTSLRDWLDAELVFWPHRNNRELAVLFDVSVLAQATGDNPNQVRLRFVPASFVSRQLNLDVTYDKATGLPIVWESYQLGKLNQRYRFQADMGADKRLAKLSVRQEDAAGNVLSLGEWIPDDTEQVAIADPETVPAGTILIDRRPLVRKTSRGIERGVELMRLGQHRQAIGELRKALEIHPEHPLVNFLVVWSLEHKSVPPNSDELRRAYDDSMKRVPVELLRFVAKRGSRYLSRREIYDLVSSRLKATDDIDDQLTLAKLLLLDSSPGEALAYANAAYQSGSRQFESLQILIEACLRTGDFATAIKKYDEWNQGQLRDFAQISELLGVFEYYEHGPDMVSRYSALLARTDEGFTIEMRRSVLQRWADVLSGGQRWEKLLTALELLPVESKRAQGELSLLLTELIQAGAVSNVVPLIKLTRHRQHKQRLMALQAELTIDPDTAQRLNWELHQAGFTFGDRLAAVCDQFNETRHPDRSLTVLEPLARKGKLSYRERRQLGVAYEMLGRIPEAKRADSLQE